MSPTALLLHALREYHYQAHSHHRRSLDSQGVMWDPLVGSTRTLPSSTQSTFPLANQTLIVPVGVLCLLSFFVCVLLCVCLLFPVAKA